MEGLLSTEPTPSSYLLLLQAIHIPKFRVVGLQDVIQNMSGSERDAREVPMLINPQLTVLLCSSP